MKKSLLIIAAFVFVFSTFAQRNLQAVKNDNAFATMDYQIANSNESLGPVNQSKTLVSNAFHSSSNGYTLISGKKVSADQTSKKVLYTARAGGSFGYTGNDISLKMTTDGVAFDSVTFVSTSSKRYPGGTFFRDGADLYVVSSGPVATSGWTHNYLYSAKIDGTNAADTLLAVPAGLGLFFMNKGLNVLETGELFIIGEKCGSDPNNTHVAYTIWKFMWNSTNKKFNFVSETDLTPAMNTTAPPVQPQGIAFSPSGDVGYFWVNMQDADSLVAYNQSTQPAIWKTLNKGQTWTRVPNYDYSQVEGLQEYVWPLLADEETIRPVFPYGYTSHDKMMPGIVDNVGNLHLLARIHGGYSNHVDSLAYSYPYESQKLFDLHTKTDGTWGATFIDSLESDVYNVGVEFGTFELDHRLHMARTEDGARIFAMWTDTKADYNEENVMPDMKAWGYNLIDNSQTETRDFTNNTSMEMSALYMNASDIVIYDNDNYIIPVVVISGSTPEQEILHHYLSGVQFAAADFNIISNALVYSVINGNGTLSATANDVAIASGISAPIGQNIVFTAIPDAGYVVREWKHNDVVVSGNISNTYAINNIQSAANVTVEFRLQNASLLTFGVEGSNGTVLASVDGANVLTNSYVQNGENIIFTASPSAGYRVKNWKLNDSIVLGNISNTYTINNIQSASNVTVEFELINYIVTYSVVGTNGTLVAVANSSNVSSSSSVQEGTDVFFTATPSIGYRVKQWEFNDIVVSGNTSNNYILTVNQTSNVTVEFELIPSNSHIVSYFVVNGNGTLSAMVDGVAFSSGYAVEQGKNVIFTAVPAIGYKVKEWKLNSNIVSGNTTNTFIASNIQQAINVTVEYELDGIQVTYSVLGSNGTLSASVEGFAINSGAMVSLNKMVVFTATPNVGYQVKEWKLNNAVISGNTSNTFVIPTLLETANVTVEFEAIAASNYSLTYYVVGGNGNLTASVDGVQIASGTLVQANKSVFFTASPNTGFVVKEWILNSNVVVGNTSNIYAVQSLQEVSVVTVEFKPDNVGISNNDKTSINIYPNPSTGLFSFVSDKKYSMKIFDNLGRIIILKQIEIGINIIDLSKYSDGLYFIHLNDSKDSHTFKIRKIE